MKEEIIAKVKDFVKKYNDRKYIVNTQPYGFDLATAIHDFEMADEEDVDYSIKVSHLNDEIDHVIASEYFHDNLTFQKLEESENRCKQLENKLKEVESIIQQLRDDKIALMTKINLYKKMYPDIRRLETTEEGDVIE